MTTVKIMARETVTCNGIFDRIKREIFNAATTPRDTEGRDERLRYWHWRQRSAEKMMHFHGLNRPYHMQPLGKLTKVQRADVRDLDRTPRWRPCPNELAAGA